MHRHPPADAHGGTPFSGSVRDVGFDDLAVVARSSGMADEHRERDMDGVPTPLESLGSLAALEVETGPGQRHIEIYTMEGLLSLFRHGPLDAENVLLMVGGAMGGVLGPAEGLYYDLAQTFATLGIGSIRVGYRKPNDLGHCLHDAAAAADLATRSGGRRFITMGHSFGGAVAINAGVAFRDHCAGVVTLSTQSAGCENADALGSTPLLLMHGDKDEILPMMASQMVQMIAGQGQVVILPGAGHLLTEAADELRQHLGAWIPEHFDSHEAAGLPGPPSQ